MALIVQSVEGLSVNKYSIDERPLIIGRAPESDIQIDDVTVSYQHAIIERLEIKPAVDNNMAQQLVKHNNKEKAEKQPVHYQIRDLGSTNGVMVNNEKITEKRLKDNDTIMIGTCMLTFVNYDNRDYEQTAKIHKSWIPGVFYTKDNK